MTRRLLWFLLRGLGVPQGLTGPGYREFASGAVFVPAAIVMLLNLQLGQFSREFWGSLTVVGVTLLIARRRALLVAALLGFVGLRLVFAFALTFDYRWLLGT